MAETESGSRESVDPPSPGHSVNDADFMRNVGRLKELRELFLREAVKLEGPADSSLLSFGDLNLLHFSPRGREPTSQEWFQVESSMQRLYAHLTDPLRRRFVLGALPRWMLALPLILALTALIALWSAIRFYGTVHAMMVVPLFMVWLLSLGAIGAVAYLGMNILSVQQDVTFDLSNRRLMLLRIFLGALFGLVLTLPFGSAGFMAFIAGGVLGKTETSTDATRQALSLLLPFVLGFSTSLVITILNRLVVGVQAIFGTSAQNSVEPAKPASSKETIH